MKYFVYNNRLHPNTHKLYGHIGQLFVFHFFVRSLILLYIYIDCSFSEGKRAFQFSSTAYIELEPYSRILRNFCQYIARFRHATNCFHYNKHVHACKLDRHCRRN